MHTSAGKAGDTLILSGHFLLMGMLVDLHDIYWSSSDNKSHTFEVKSGEKKRHGLGNSCSDGVFL